jgi:hypothetical protein
VKKADGGAATSDGALTALYNQVKADHKGHDPKIIVEFK